MTRPLPRGALTAATDAVLATMEGNGDFTWTTRNHARRLAEVALEAAMPGIERAVLRHAARQILLLEALARGWACPACHGKPAVTPSVMEGRTGYQCGCGREWEPPRSRNYAMDPDSLLKRIARGEPLPELPPKEEPE